MNQYAHSFRKLISWKESKILTLQVYKATQHFPQYELYGITSQLRRSSSSVMANLAEGNERSSKKDMLKFFIISRSSLAETDCFLELALDLGYLNADEYSQLLNQLNKTAFLLSKLISSFSIKRTTLLVGFSFALLTGITILTSISNII